MKMHLLSGGRLRMRKSIFVPDANKSETIELSFRARSFAMPEPMCCSILAAIRQWPNTPRRAGAGWRG